MSYAQFGYPYHPASQILVSGQTGSSTVAPNPCCESGRAVVTDPVTGQAVFSCQQCDSHSLVYPRLGSSVPSGPYAPYSEQSYPPVGMESSTFYSSLGAPYVLKEGNSDVPGWQSMSQPTGYYPYDPSLAAYGYGYDLNGARRKNATREATTTLKTWLNDHKKNPYPTKGEKIMLAIITKMTLTQVSTWFANARRRLKKENKITWNSKGKDDDEDEEDGKLSDIDDDKDSSSDRLDGSSSNDGTTNKMADLAYEKSTDSKDMLQGYDKDTGCNNPLVAGSASGGGMMVRLGCDTSSSTSAASSPSLHSMAHQMNHIQQQHMSRYPMDLHDPERLKNCNPMEKELQSPPGGGALHPGAPLDVSNPSMASQNKPKIWSLADTATCKTPPTSSLAPPRPNCAAMAMPAGGATSLAGWSSAASHPLPPFQVTSGAYGSHHPYQPQNKPCGDVTSAMAARTSGQCSNNAFSADLQTDTPPQTPPNHKFPSVQVNYAHHASGAPMAPSQGYSEHYGGGTQRALLSSVNSRLHDFQGENL